MPPVIFQGDRRPGSNQISTFQSQPRGPTLYGPRSTFHVPAPIFPLRYGGVDQPSSIVNSILLLPLQPRNPGLPSVMPRSSNSPRSSVLPPPINGSESI